MVERRLSDGTRIAQLVASEIEGLGGPLGPASVVDATPDVEPTAAGAVAYTVAVSAERNGVEDEHQRPDERGSEQIADVFVQPERVRVEFAAGQQLAAEVAAENGLRVRPKASEPPRTLVFVEDGAEVKRASRVFEAVVAARE